MSLISKPSIGREVAFLDSERRRAWLGFGCAGLMQLASRHHRQRLLGEAYEQGVRHFDVARMYGLGMAEHELGRFARGRRDQITIATKFGIDPSGPASRLTSLQGPARAAIARFPALRTALKRRQGAFHKTLHYSPEAARASLKTSLEELDTDYVDILFIHDPGAADLVDMEQLADALEDLRREGHVRAWGVSGQLEPCLRIRDAVDVPIVLQLRDDILNPTLAQVSSNAPVITFGVLSNALNRVLAHLAGSEERRLRWSRAVGQDCGRPEIVASLLLQDALDRNASGGVLFSTTRRERVWAATVAAEAVSPDLESASLGAFRHCVRAELSNSLGEACG